MCYVSAEAVQHLTTKMSVKNGFLKAITLDVVDRSSKSMGEFENEHSGDLKANRMIGSNKVRSFCLKL